MASLVPIFLAGMSMLSCQQRYYMESQWGGLVVLSSILIYSFKLGEQGRAGAERDGALTGQVEQASRRPLPKQAL